MPVRNPSVSMRRESEGSEKNVCSPKTIGHVDICQWDRFPATDHEDVPMPDMVSTVRLIVFLFILVTNCEPHFFVHSWSGLLVQREAPLWRAPLGLAHCVCLYVSFVLKLLLIELIRVVDRKLNFHHLL